MAIGFNRGKEIEKPAGRYSTDVGKKVRIDTGARSYYGVLQHTNHDLLFLGPHADFIPDGNGDGYYKWTPRVLKLPTDQVIGLAETTTEIVEDMIVGSEKNYKNKEEK